MALTVEEIENVIAQLPKKQLEKFRAWYEKFDSDTWDKQIETDTINGSLDSLAAAAIADHKSGRLSLRF